MEKDPAEALRWYRKAAAQGRGIAMMRIGQFYENGTGVEKNPDEAAKWYKQAIATHEQTFAEGHLLRLSKAGLIREKYEGVPVEGGLVLTQVDETTAIGDLLKDLAKNPREIETGKAYWIGYNAQMQSIAARGESAIPHLVDFIKKSSESKVRHAGLLALHLIGIENNVAWRFEEDFKNRKAREALWDLMQVEGLTDEVASLLKRDPWPADVPAILEALAKIKGDSPDTLNALLRYSLSKRPIDTLADSQLGGTSIRFTVPREYTDRDYVRVAVEGIKEALHGRVQVEEGALDQIPVPSRHGSPAPHGWEGTLDKLLIEIKNLRAPFDYIMPGRNIYYYTEGRLHDDEHPATLHLCTAATAKKRWLKWWKETGQAWYSFNPNPLTPAAADPPESAPPAGG